MSFDVHISGLDPFERKAQRLALFMQDLRSLWPLVIPVVTSWWSRQFDTGGEFGGSPWAPLNTDYLARKQALGLRTDILQATGQLKQAASRPSRSVTPTSLTLTIDDSGDAHGNVLQYHQEGTATMPARPLVFGDPLGAVPAAELQAVAGVYIRDLLLRV